MSVKGIPFGNFESAAVVTGAAGGMGRIYSGLLAENGYCLIMVDISEDRLEQAAAEVRDLVDKSGLDTAGKFKLLPLAQDLSRMDAASEVGKAAERFGVPVDILINNAGLFFFKEIASTDKKLLSTIMMVHNYTPLMLCREFVPGMIARGKGYVLNVSSLAAWMDWPAIGMYGNTKRFVKGFSRIPWPGLGMYASTKRFVKDFSRALRVECRGTGVSVTNAYFGAVDTPLIPLKPSLRRLARRLGVMISADRATDKALSALFRRKKGTMPGILNRIFLPVVILLPDCLISWIVRKLGRYIMMDV